MNTKNIRCPFEDECEREKCDYYRNEEECRYYRDNAMGEDLIDDDEDDGDGAELAEQFGMTGQALAEERPIEVIETEIKFYKAQAGASIIEIGKRLNEAKEQLSHGEWLPWLKEKVEFSEASAQRFMRLAKEYSKSVTLTDLGVSKALVLLALPASEREEFAVEKHTVNGEEKTAFEMTKKELEQAIRERDEARMERDAAKAREQDGKIDYQSALNRANEAEKELQELKSKPVEVAVQTVDASAEQIAQARADGIREATDEAKKAVAAAEAAKQKLSEELEKQKELTEKAKKLGSGAEKKMLEANAKVEAAERRYKEAEERARAAEIEAERAKKLAQNSGREDMVRFKILFASVQKDLQELKRLAGAADEAEREKLGAALKALAGVIVGEE